MMEDLVNTVNQLQDVFSTGVSSGIDLPQIVVVGSQSAGKSSVLEQIVGKSFLPRGTGIVTRCPLVLQLVRASPATEEYAVFQHDDTKKFTDYNLIRKEIEKQTVEIAGPTKDICHTSINLKLYSPNLLDLTLVDLPGMMKVPVGDQPLDIVKQTRNLILNFIKNPNCIILAVTPANNDMATSDSLEIAKEVDPQGKRTLAVLTKLDLMDEGTDAWDMLQGNVIPVKLGIIGVINRSQKSINEDKAVTDSLNEEAAFFKKNYEDISDVHGSPYLARRVQEILVNHIKDCMPDLKKKIVQKLSKIKSQLSRYPKSSLVDSNALLLNVIFKFTNIFSSSLKGCLTNILSEGLQGGARVHAIFKKSFAEDLNEIDPLCNLERHTVLNAIKNSNGMNPELYPPVAAFTELVKGQIKQFLHPSVRVVELVHLELNNIAETCTEDKSLQLDHYPRLKIALKNVVTELLLSYVSTTKQAVEYFIDIQCSYINTDHPDFTPKQSQSVEIVNRDASNRSINPQLWLKVPVNDDESNVKDRDSVDYALMVSCIKSYMAIVSKDVEDKVPKIIIHSMVNTVVEQIYDKLVEQIYDKGNCKEVMCESSGMIIKRNKLEAEIAKLEKAEKIVRNISAN